MCVCACVCVRVCVCLCLCVRTQELVRFTPETHEDYAKLNVALVKINSIAMEINEKKRTEEESRKLIELEKEISGLTSHEFVVIQPSRRIVKRGTLKRVTRSKISTTHLILFNDALLITTPGKMIKKSSYELKEVIMLNMALVTDEPDVKHKYTFDVIHISKNKKYTFSAASDEDKTDWLTCLNDLINPHLERGFKRSKEEASMIVSEGRRPLPPLPPAGYAESMIRFKCTMQDVRFVELPRAEPKVRA